MTDDRAFEALLQPLWSAISPDKLHLEPIAAKRGLTKKLNGFCLRVPACNTVSIKTEWRRRCEVVELLLLASMVNPREFARLARKHLALISQKLAHMNWNHIGHDQLVPCRLVVEFHYLTGWFCPQWPANALSLLLGPEWHASERSDLSETREKLLAMAPTPRVRQEWVATKIPVCVRLMHCKKDDVEAVVKHLLTLYQARSTCQEGIESPFQADVVELRYREDLTTRLPHPMSNWLQELSSVGLALRWINSDELLDGQVAVSAITGASNIRIQANSTYSQGAQVMKIKMDGTDICKAMCMGLMHSSGLEHVTLESILGMNGVVWSKWYWLLYSLFHASATHSIRSLKIYDMVFSTADLQRFRGLFQAPQPLQVIYPRAKKAKKSTTLKTGSFVVLNNDARVFFNQHRRNEDEYVMASSIETPFRVIGADGDMTSVLVPCYGECRVHRSDIVSTHPDPFESDPKKQWNLTSHGITHLEVVYNEAQPTSEILDVLELIGQPVTSISIDLPGFSRAEPFDLDNLWLFCPNLTELSLKGVCLDSLDVFVQAYETGVCCLTSLEILGCDVLAQDSVATFTTALGDPSTAISCTLTHLRISLAKQYDKENGVSDDEVAQLFLSALQTNKRLSLLELQVNEEVLDNTHADEFEALNGSYLNYVCNPLSLRTMCGFLSVIKHAQTEANDGPLAHMDAFVLSRIIRMAAEPGRRSVVLAERSHFFGQ